MLPPDRPSTIRATNNIVMLWASASITKLTTVPDQADDEDRPAAVAIREITEELATRSAGTARTRRTACRQ
jgi:hypothetical protein